jgi:hypothetical protein
MEDDKLETIGAFILIIIIICLIIYVSKTTGKHIEYKGKGWYEVSK